MDDLTSDFHQVVKPSTSISELNSSMELLHNFTELNHQPLNSHFLDYFSTEFLNHPSHTVQLPPYSTSEGAHQGLFCSFDQTNAGNFGVRHEGNVVPVPEFAETPSPTGFPVGFGGDDKNSGTGGRKRKRKADVEGSEKTKEVIHVRAKRGQATDSHSLAERVRRERINEKLKVLQDLVPGCYKTMGMAVMLDVIINYVRSLQNQIEFLSMKLSAASMVYDFNSPEAEAIELLQRATNGGEALGARRVTREGYGEISMAGLYSTWPF